MKEEITSGREECATDPVFIWEGDIEKPLAILKRRVYNVSQIWNHRILELLGIEEEEINEEGNYVGKKIVDML